MLKPNKPAIYLITSTPVMEAISFFETSVLTRATQCHIPVDGTLQSLEQIVAGNAET
jgi:hypothetical protein